jgi:hypothetical protein
MFVVILLKMCDVGHTRKISVCEEHSMMASLLSNWSIRRQLYRPLCEKRTAA